MLQDLTDKIKYHNRLYWEDNNPEISDIAYDILLQQLETLDPTNELLHLHKNDVNFTSLEKTYYFGMSPKGKKSLMNWVDDRARSDTEIFLVQPKYDGISVYYDGKGTLVSRDQDISNKLPLIEVETSDYVGQLNTTPIRGELLIRNDDFTTIYNTVVRKDGSSYKNSRNAVGGIIALKDISNVQAQGAKLTLVDFNLVTYAIAANAFLNNWDETVERIKQLPYPMDGIVIKVHDKKYAKELGSNNTHTKSAIAFKFTRESKQSKLLGITWNMGRENLTPVGHIEPVELGGVSITNVTLHNVQYIKKSDIAINDILTIERAGDVIPKVIGCSKGTNRQSPYITHCPYCGHGVIEIRQELRCLNKQCSERLKQQLYLSAVRLGIEELGLPTIHKLWDTLDVKNTIDLLSLSINDISKLDGFKEKSTIKLYKNINKGKHVEAYQFLAALNIPLIGLRISTKLLQQCSLDDVLSNKVNYTSINGIGHEMGRALSDYMINNKDYINALLQIISIKTNVPIIADKQICFTGKMDMSRKELHALAIRAGYSPVSTVTSKLSTLVVDDLDSKSSKTKKARKYHIPIMTILEWKEYCNLN